MNNDAETYATFTEWCSAKDIVYFREAFWHYLAEQAGDCDIRNVPNDPEVWQTEWEKFLPLIMAAIGERREAEHG